MHGSGTALGWAAAWAPPFVATLAVELPVYALVLRRELGVRGALLVAFLLNAITHPLAWSAIMAAPRPYPRLFLSVEALVVVAEALLLLALTRATRPRRSLTPRLAFASSLSANALSAGIGLLL